jgi:hypothetical protein
MSAVERCQCMSRSRAFASSCRAEWAESWPCVACVGATANALHSGSRPKLVRSDRTRARRSAARLGPSGLVVARVGLDLGGNRTSEDIGEGILLLPMRDVLDHRCHGTGQLEVAHGRHREPRQLGTADIDRRVFECTARCASWPPVMLRSTPWELPRTTCRRAIRRCRCI